MNLIITIGLATICLIALFNWHKLLWKPTGSIGWR